ncbi:MAG: SDR family oxidoreductase [Myxococcota bacterium]|nr:SDR family oxidoreductase [Myxococcota bacterium]
MSGVVLITGCSRGIGRESALRLAELGWTVVGTLRSDSGQAELEAGGVEVVRMDVTRPDEVAGAVQSIVARHGGIDALVANAGRGLFGCFETLEEQQARDLMDVNFFGVLSCAREALPHLRQSRGRLVVISSIAGRRAAPGSSLYNASKFAIEGWAEGLSYELAPFGVDVVLVEPGPTESGFFDVKWWGKRELSAYTPLNARLQELQDSVKDKCVPVGVVVDAVVAALTKPKPAFRIPTGTNTKMQLLAKSSLPERWWRGLVQKAVGFPDQD